MKRLDYLIVGFGLAGATVAIELLKRNKSFIILDLPGGNRASAIAAGLFNPIAGKTMVLTWKADQVFSLLHRWYPEAEEMLGAHFFFSRPIYRPFVSAGEQNEWMSRSAEPKFVNYVEKVETTPRNPAQVVNPFGGLLLSQCGYLDVPRFLSSVRQLLVGKDQYVATTFKYEDLVVSGVITYGGLYANKVVFCEGTHVRQNPFFSWLPIRPLGGEVLEVELTEEPEYLYNRHVYVVPQSDGLYKVGATYVNREIAGISAEGRKELTERLNELLKIPSRLVNQQWGIRPVVLDRKPILGPHPKYPNVVILNGLGTKGVSLAPYCAKQLCSWLEDGLDLDAETNIDRFKSLYSKF